MSHATWRSLRALLAVVTLASAGGFALARALTVDASSVTYSSAGNCNYNHPHGWSITSWSGYATSQNGYVNGTLWWWWNNTWNQNATSSGSNSGTTAQASADNYYPYAVSQEYWEETGTHWGSMINGTQNSYGNQMWCP